MCASHSSIRATSDCSPNRNNLRSAAVMKSTLVAYLANRTSISFRVPSSLKSDANSFRVRLPLPSSSAFYEHMHKYSLHNHSNNTRMPASHIPQTSSSHLCVKSQCSASGTVYQFLSETMYHLHWYLLTRKVPETTYTTKGKMFHE